MFQTTTFLTHDYNCSLNHWSSITPKAKKETFVQEMLLNKFCEIKHIADLKLLCHKDTGRSAIDFEIRGGNREIKGNTGI